MRLVPCISIILVSSSVSVVSQAPSSYPTGRQERTLRRQYEDEVAQSFEKFRDKDKLTRLKRIAHRQSLEQLVCTAALNDAPAWSQNSPGAVMYRTDNLAFVTQELERIACYKEIFPGSDSPPYTRYAVAVWPATDKKSGQPIYWIGIETYMSAWWEFLDNNFTDNRSYKDDWKKAVAPACRVVD